MISLQNLRAAEGLLEKLEIIKDRIENSVNLERWEFLDRKKIVISNNAIMRICLWAGLSITNERNRDDIESIQLSKNSQRLYDPIFTIYNLSNIYSPILKLRYRNLNIDWENGVLKSKIINHEMLMGMELLKDNSILEDWLLNTENNLGSNRTDGIPFLNLDIGMYEGDIPAKLNLNGNEVTNTQILIAGTTGSGKSNLLAVLINEIRQLSFESDYPVNFLLFDYKGEFSDKANSSWLEHFEVDGSCILDPMVKPLPFSPFKDFRGKPQNEINLYSTQLAEALCAIDKASMSANMSNKLSEAIINCYKSSNNLPITFERVLNHYINLQNDKDKDKDDSIKSVLKQLIRTNLFAEADTIDLIKNSFIIKMKDFPKDGVIAKAIVYFIISKFNILYEKLPKQNKDDQKVELRHFTIIDEAHYMLGFDNKPLRDLIAVGRDKGLSIILATQNMDSYKSEHFDFFANAQYPLIMKQQSINDGVIKDLFGVSGKEYNEIKEEISGLQKGELIIKNSDAYELGIGKKYKKIKVRHLI